MTDKDMTTTYNRLKCSLPVSDEDAAELSIRLKKVKRRESYVAIAFTMLAIAMLVFIAFQ